MLVECVAIAVGWAAIVGLDGRWPWRLLRLMTVIVVVGGVVVARRATGHQRIAAAAAMVVAAVSIPAAGTIAVAHAMRGRWNLRALAAVLATAASLVLIIGAFRLLLRGARRWIRWTAVPVAVVGGLVAVAAMFPAVYATNVPRPRLGSERPSDHGLVAEDVRFVTDDGVTLSGWYVPSRNRAAIVLVHGASSTRTSVLGHMAALAGEGYGALAFDARGHGLSGGRAMEFGWYGDTDISAAVTFLERRTDVDRDRIGVVGLSMGGEEAIGALANDGRIHAVVAEGATNRVFADKRWLADEYGWRGTAQLAIEWATYHLTALLTSAPEPPPLAQSLRVADPRPVLLIAAGNVTDECTVARRLHDASPRNVSVWIAADTDHTGALRVHRGEWVQRVNAFFQAALFATPAMW